MPISPKALVIKDAFGTGMSEVLYESATTRVFRPGDASAATRLVCKEYLGSQAVQRRRIERDVLERLSGIEGVAQRAHEAHRPGVLTLQDCGAIALAHILDAGACDLPTVLSVASQLARTLAAVHRAGVIHRDINPANILLSPAHQAVLIDFDLAVLAEQAMEAPPGGHIVGTLAYLAPEQTGRTGRAVDQRADLYALGATLYEMATGQTPFEGRDMLQMIHDHLVREPAAPSRLDARVPVGLSNIILRLLAKAPEQRYQSAEGLLHDLLRLRAELDCGNAGIFELGERDFTARLAAPEQLVGRDAELAMLHTALADAMHTPRRTVLIEGAAGVGKSALIQQLRPIVAAAGGWFISGKFDQYHQAGATAGAITQALGTLGRLLLAQTPDALALQRRRILDSLGRNAGLVTRLSPEFALLLGEQPDLAQADPRQAEPQLQQATVDLLGAVASPERPLVMVLDDLQWASAMSLRTLERLMRGSQLQGLLLVGIYRAEEVGTGHVLAPMLMQWRQQPQAPLHITLANLTPEGLGELLVRTLRLPLARAAELARAVFALTGGNPFDALELINALRWDGVLSLDHLGWQWDSAAIHHFVGRSNVVDLLAARIGRLPAASRELLECMSCLGNEVEYALLGAAVGLNDSALWARLRPPLEDGLLLADSRDGHDGVRFRHDRVQQAVLDSMDDARRGKHQLAMARRLVRDPAFEAQAAQMYLASSGHLDEPQEQRHAARLLHGMAQKLAGRAIHLLAEHYLAAAGALLAAAGDPVDTARRGAIDAARHAALYSLGRLDDSDPLYAAMQARMADPLDLVEPTCLQIRSLDMRGRMGDAIALGLHLLAQLGLNLPPVYRAPDREQRLDALDEWVRQDSLVDHSKRTQMQDARLLGIAKLLGRVVGSAYLSSNLDAFACFLLESQRLWAKHGPCAELVACMGHMNAMLVGLRHDYRTGFNIARHVLTVGEALGHEAQTSEARYRFAGHACAWFEPLEHALEHATRACQDLQARGDISFACYGHTYMLLPLLDIAPTIDIHDAEIEAGMALCRRAGNLHAGAMHTCEQQFLRALRGQTFAFDSFDDGQFNEQAFMARVGHLPYVDFEFYRALQALIGGNATALARHAPVLIPRTKGVSAGHFRVSHACLFVALARAWQIAQADPSTGDLAPLITELESCRSWLAGRAADQPYNFLHLLRLVEAEQAWALDDPWKAAVAFDAAVLEAETRERPWHKALITERAGLFHLARGLAGTGRNFLARACDHYQAWGAGAKVTQMRRDHAFLNTPQQARIQATQPGIHAGHSVRGGTNNVSSDALDLVGLLRASQALSSETSLDRLSSRVTEVLAALSGATKVLVLACNDDQWSLLAPAPGESSMPVELAAQRGLLPLSAFGYAERTAETLVVSDTSRDDRFSRDAYFANVPLCSLLVVPIGGQSSTRAMLLLENRLNRAAFNAQRLDTVMLIAGQLAVSLSNAQLYESLEQRVQARTRELEQTQAELVAFARRAGKAEIANNVLHNVGNVLNSVNVSASVVRRNISESRAQGLARAVALMNEHEHDLPGFIGRDPRGRALLGYFNELVGALQQERQSALGDLDRLASSVEHITYVVATQQSHSGPSSVLELVQPHELLEEALQLSEQVIARARVTVVRQYVDVMVTTLDKQRLLQILVNLIGNAAQAMERTPEASRRLALNTQRVQDDSGDWLHISVQDEGEGIAPANLTRIFAHGFTTRQDGHGFGLHSAALAAMEMGGRLTAHSEGPGRGAVFILSLPILAPVALLPATAT